METITRVIPRGSSKKKTKPVVIKWNGAKMLRNQSINACVDEIFETSKSMGFVKINLIGASSSGKTVLGSVLMLVKQLDRLYRRVCRSSSEYLQQNTSKAGGI